MTDNDLEPSPRYRRKGNAAAPQEQPSVVPEPAPARWTPPEVLPPVPPLPQTPQQWSPPPLPPIPPVPPLPPIPQQTPWTPPPAPRVPDATPEVFDDFDTTLTSQRSPES